MHRLHHVCLPLLAAAMAAGCAKVPTLPGVTPYRIEIQQGNFVSQEMVSQLKLGMSREQVRFVLGTPLVADIFHADRWDYPFFRDVPGKPREQRKFSVFFEDGKLARITGDVVPAATPTQEKPAAAKPAPVAQPAAVPKTEPEAPVGQNWSAASDDPNYGKETAKPAPEAAKPAAEKPAERGFFGRMIDRIKGD